MGNSIKKYEELVEEGQIKDIEVYDYQCLCSESSNCTLCTKTKSYLVTRWVQNFEEEGMEDSYRFEDKSLDYVKGFVEGLNADNTTSRVTFSEVKE